MAFGRSLAVGGTGSKLSGGHGRVAAAVLAAVALMTSSTPIASADEGAGGQRVRAEGRFGTAQVDLRTESHTHDTYVVGITARDSMPGQQAPVPVASAGEGAAPGNSAIGASSRASTTSGSSSSGGSALSGTGLIGGLRPMPPRPAVFVADASPRAEPAPGATVPYRADARLGTGGSEPLRSYTFNELIAMLQQPG